MKQPTIIGLYYITHINNIRSILRHGILSHQSILDRGIQFTPIYDADIVANRNLRRTPDGRTLWKFANVFFQPRNPMLYRVLIEKSVEDIVVIGVRPTVLNNSALYITTGNAASQLSDILPASQGLKQIYKIKKATDKEWWTVEDSSKREIMAECLLPDEILPDYIQEIFVANVETQQKVREAISGYDIPIIREPRMFFRPYLQKELTPRLSLVEGDMFFSRMQTLTISVNVVGVMGKGLASRAKYQFPAVYVAYQDFCRRKTIRMGKPVVYTMEISVDQQLADEGENLRNGQLKTNFLLFPTKNHWRQIADLEGIKQGLQWLQTNYVKAGMESLAIPALGCGLGQLEWRVVGPLMCGYLSTLSIPVQIYLPAEKKVDGEYLTAEYLLGG